MKIVFDENHHKLGRNHLQSTIMYMTLQSICIDQHQYEYLQHMETSIRDMTTLEKEVWSSLQEGNAFECIHH